MDRTGARVRRLGRDLGREVRGVERRPLLLSALAAAIALAVSLAMAGVAGLGRTRHVLLHADEEWLALILGGMIVSYGGFASAYRGTVAGTERLRLPVRVTLKLVAFGAAASSLLGGYSVDRRALRGAGASRGDAGAQVMTMSAIEYMVLALAAWISALTLLQAAHVQRAVSLPWAIGFPVGCAVALVVASRVRPATAEPSGSDGLLRRSARMTLDALRQLREQVRHPLRHRAAWGGMTLHWAGDLVAMWAAMRAVGLTPSLAVLILGYATGYALSPRSLPLAGVGVTEALMPLALNWVGLPLAQAVVAVFMYRMGRLVVSVPPALLAAPEVRRLLGH